MKLPLLFNAVEGAETYRKHTRRWQLKAGKDMLRAISSNCTARVSFSTCLLVSQKICFIAGAFYKESKEEEIESRTPQTNNVYVLNFERHIPGLCIRGNYIIVEVCRSMYGFTEADRRTNQWVIVILTKIKSHNIFSVMGKRAGYDGCIDTIFNIRWWMITAMTESSLSSSVTVLYKVDFKV